MNLSPSDSPSLNDRVAKLLAGIPKSGKILEIGPSYNPIVTREAGWDCYSIDHGSQEELKAKYANDPNAGYGVRIQPVDFVWRGGPMESAVPKEHHGTFDACIASHVVEHTPDLVAFLNSIAVLLKPGGILTLAVPDKRYCFDYFQSITSTGDILEAHAAKRTRHTARSLFNGNATASLPNGAITVSQQDVSQTPLMMPALNLPDAWQLFARHDGTENTVYQDCHAWYFTPSSFRLIALDLRAMGLIPFAEERWFESNGCEFYIHLRRDSDAALPSGEELGRLRETLLRGIVFDLGVQTDLLVRRESDVPIPAYHRHAAQDKASLQEKLDSTKTRLKEKITQLEDVLAQAQQNQREIRQQVDAWNRRSWLQRATHKLRIAKKN